MSPSVHLARRASLLSILLTIAGCHSLYPSLSSEISERLPEGPDYVHWMPQHYRAATPPEPTGDSLQPVLKPSLDIKLVPLEADRLLRPKQAWWTEFGNSELDRLVETALANNYDLRVAVARIEQAERQARIADGARTPSVDLFAGVEQRAPAEGVGTANNRNDWRSRGIYQFGLRMNYEVDLWGRLGYEARSALELARASAFNREVVGLTLIAETTNTYFQYLSLNERIAIAQKGHRLAQEVANAISRRVQRGDASRIEQQQQQIAIALLENNLAGLRLQQERSLTRLAVFLGRPPSAIKLTGKSLQNMRLPKIEPGLPSEQLCRRPDIRRAEAELAAASADVEAARANLLPSFALTGQLGQGSFRLSELLSPQSILYSLAGNLVGNVFDGERKENQLAQTRARNRELLEQYANTVLAALRDVEDSLTGIRLAGQQQQALAEALTRNDKLLKMNRQTFKLGALDLISFLDVQRNVYLAQDAEASARLEQMRSTIDLFKALGGVAQRQADPCVVPLAGMREPALAYANPASIAPVVDTDASLTPAAPALLLRMTQKLQQPLARPKTQAVTDNAK